MRYGIVPVREERYANGRIYRAGDKYPIYEEKVKPTKKEVTKPIDDIKPELEAKHGLHAE